MKLLDKQLEKNYTIKYRPQSNSIEAWSVQRLPFEPKGWLMDFRNELRTSIHRLQNHPGQILHGIYAAPPGSLCDTENILFYNVGSGQFTPLITTGLLFERCYSCPDPPNPLGATLLHYHRYTMVDGHDGFSCWQTNKLVAAWENVEIPRLSGKITETNTWYSLRSRPMKTFHMPEHPLTRFGLSITVTLPVTATTTLAHLMKPIIDGVVSAFHAYRGAEMEQVSQWLGAELGQAPSEIVDLLQKPDQAVLGGRRVVYPFRNAYKWDPADDLCLAAELFLQPYTGKDWLLSGKLFEIEYCEPFFR